MHPCRRVILNVVSQRQESLVRHIIDSWHERKVATARVPIMPEMLIDMDDGQAYIEAEECYRLDRMTSGRLVISRKFTWYVVPGIAMFPAEVNLGLMSPIRGDLLEMARRLSSDRASASLVLEITALCLPMGPDLLPDTRDSWPCDDPGMNVTSEPRADRPMPLGEIFRDVQGNLNIRPDTDTQDDYESWANASSPDTSRPYPLDALLAEIEGLTG